MRASHILLKTEGKDDAAVKAQAESLLKQVNAGGDFAALATKFSEDEGSAKNGGDLDLLRARPDGEGVRGRGLFAAAGQDQRPGEDAVRYHIIKVVDKKPAATRPLEEVRQQIADQLAYERAQAQVTELATKLAARIKRPADLDPWRSPRPHSRRSRPFSRRKSHQGLGPGARVASEAFLDEGRRDGRPVRVARGQVFFTLTGNRTRGSRRSMRSRTVSGLTPYARRRGREPPTRRSLAAQFKTNFDAVAKTAGLEVKTTELIPRGSPLPDSV